MKSVCIVCDHCRAVLANNGESIPWDKDDGDTRIEGFPSNQAGDEAAVEAGRRVRPGEYEDGEVTFHSEAQGEHLCPECRGTTLGNLDELKRQLNCRKTTAHPDMPDPEQPESANQKGSL